MAIHHWMLVVVIFFLFEQLSAPFIRQSFALLIKYYRVTRTLRSLVCGINLWDSFALTVSHRLLNGSYSYLEFSFVQQYNNNTCGVSEIYVTRIFS